MKLILLILCLLVWHQVDGVPRNNGKNSNSRLLYWAKKGVLALTINYAMNANVNSNANEIACPFTIPEVNKMEKMYWITCAQKETDLEKYFTQNPEVCPGVRTLYSKVKTWVKDKCFATQPKSIVDSAVSSFKREKKKPNHKEQMMLFEDYLKVCQAETTYDDEKDELMKIAKRDNEFDFFAMRSAEKLFSYSHVKITALKKALGKYKSADYEQKIQNFQLLTDIYPQEALESKYDGKDFDQVHKVIEFLDKNVPDHFRIEWEGEKSAFIYAHSLSEYDGKNFDQLDKAFEYFNKYLYLYRGMAAYQALSYVIQYQGKNFDEVNKTFEYLYPYVIPSKHAAALQALSIKYDNDMTSVQPSDQKAEPALNVVYLTGDLVTGGFGAVEYYEKRYDL